jgi:ABC-type histidine transport system ATPase subunit
MSESEKIIDNTSENEVLSNTKQSVVGDIYVQDVHKSFGVTKALDGVNFSANFA